jgi:hypothetical protein
MLGGTCCVLSLVDIDKVIWKSVAFAGASNIHIKEEARYINLTKI